MNGGTESGFIKSKFMYGRPLIGTDIDSHQPVHILGLPVIGLTLTRFTNNNAQPGVLAQYGFTHPLKAKKRIELP